MNKSFVDLKTQMKTNLVQLFKNLKTCMPLLVLISLRLKIPSGKCLKSILPDQHWQLLLFLLPIQILPQLHPVWKKSRYVTTQVIRTCRPGHEKVAPSPGSESECLTQVGKSLADPLKSRRH